MGKGEKEDSEGGGADFPRELPLNSELSDMMSYCIAISSLSRIR